MDTLAADSVAVRESGEGDDAFSLINEVCKRGEIPIL
jgi:hypothetical protein